MDLVGASGLETRKPLGLELHSRLSVHSGGIFTFLFSKAKSSELRKEEWPLSRITPTPPLPPRPAKLCYCVKNFLFENRFRLIRSYKSNTESTHVIFTWLPPVIITIIKIRELTLIKYDQLNYRPFLILPVFTFYSICMCTCVCVCVCVCVYVWRERKGK